MNKNNSSHVEQRLKRVEAELEQLRLDVRQCKDAGWRAIVGGHRGSQTFDDVVEEIRKRRQKEYTEVRGKRLRSGSARKVVGATG